MKKQKAITISSRVKSKRDLYGISMDELAIACRVTTNTLYRHLRTPDIMTLKELKALSKKLHMTVSELIGEETNEY